MQNQTNHGIFAKDSRRLGNMHPQNFKIRYRFLTKKIVRVAVRIF
mgnify:FL=1